jgi:hypothetical protein
MQKTNIAYVSFLMTINHLFLGKQHLKMTASDFATFKQLQTSIFCNAFLGDPNNAAKFQFLMHTKIIKISFFPI